MKLPSLFEVEPKHFTAGTTIFEAGQPGDAMYVVQDGQVELRVRDQVVETVVPEGFFGEMALLDNHPRSATAIARTDCTLIPVNQTHFTFMLQETPFFAIEVMKVMASRLRRGNASE